MEKSNLALDSFAAGHGSRAMLSRYSHVRMEAKRRALDEIAVRQRAADEKRGDAERRRAGCGQIRHGACATSPSESLTAVASGDCRVREIAPAQADACRKRRCRPSPECLFRSAAAATSL